MNALREFLAGGQDRRAALENALTYYIPPELRGWLGLASELNPVVGMERAGGSARAVADPNVQGWDKVKAIGDTASDMANAAAPMMMMGVKMGPINNPAADELEDEAHNALSGYLAERGL